MMLDLNPDVINDPEEADRIAAVLSQLRKYHAVKAAALRARLTGDIQDAMDLEHRLDLIYAGLPEEARW